MKERPILFSAPMVRAILDGRKTQTRRILKGSTEHKGVYNPAYLAVHQNDKGWKQICPYGKPGDQLWVRETFATGNPEHYWGNPIYKATFGAALKPVCEGFTKWKPSIHMPRAASRIDLLIKDIRVERLQDISKADCMAEGMSGLQDIHAGWHQSYAGLWEKINGKNSWDENPWVWVIEFEKQENPTTKEGE